MRNALEHLIWDHPRVCGEQLLYSLPLTFLQGSSPRVRGAEDS